MLWAKQLGRVVGVDVHAVSLAVGAFFAGMALGGFVVGRRADRSPRPLRLYAALELAAAALAVGATLALAAAPPLFAALEARVGPLAWALPFALVAAPATAMGGTLPALLRAVGPDAGRIGAAGGALYAANTAGAIAGALLVPFALVPALGIRGTALAAAALQLAAALGALALDRSVPAREAAAPDSPPRARADGARTALALYALAGAIALGYEVVFSQVLVPFLSTRTYAFAVVLATYLAGLALGSAVMARRADRLRDPWGAFAVLIAAAGLVALLELAALGRWLVVWQTQAEAAVLALTGLPVGSLAGLSARFAVAALCFVLAPALLLGAAFPIALRLAAGAESIGRDAGATLALNTAGGVAGTLLVGLVTIPALGLVRSLAALALCAAAAALFAAFRGRAEPRARGAVLAIAAAALLAAVVVPADKLAALLPGGRTGQLVRYDESAGGTVAVVEQGSASARFRRLYVDGVSNSGDALPSLRYMRLQALLPLLVHRGEPRAALVIGLGTGITAGALLADPGLERRVVAELLPAVARAAPLFGGNFGAPADPRIELRLRDGRRELLRDAGRYDVITLEPPPPSAAGVANLYSADFYALAARRLGPDGLLAQWLPLATQSSDETRSLVQSVLAVFPYATLWTTELHEMLIVASASPIELDVPRIAERFASPAIQRALREVGVASPAALLATWVGDRTALERFAGDAPPVTDDRPRIEFAAWTGPQELGRVLPELLALATPAPLRGDDPAFAAALAGERHRLLGLYAAALAAYRGELETSKAALESLLAAAPDNAYYAWFAPSRRSP